MSEVSSKTEESRTNLMVWDVPTDVKERFKLKCQEKKRTMKSVIVELMNRFASRK